jgi:hypothetical protein
MEDVRLPVRSESAVEPAVPSTRTGLGIDSSKLWSDGALNTLRLAAATACELSSICSPVCSPLSELSSSSLVAGAATPVTAVLASDASSSRTMCRTRLTIFPTASSVQQKTPIKIGQRFVEFNDLQIDSKT